jgi:butyryl-CoA dehydrogenase
MDEVMAPAPAAPPDGDRALLDAARKLTLFAAGIALQRYTTGLAEEQEIVGALADAIIEVYAIESAILRAEKTGSRRAIAMTRFYAERAFSVVEASAKKVVAASSEGDAFRTHLAILRRLARREPANTVALSREIVAAMLAG